MKILLYLIFFFCIGWSAAYGQERSADFNWPGKYKAAVCLTYDDGLDSHLDVAIPALDSFNLKGTFYCTGFSTSLHSRLDEWRAIASEGHELGNHTLFHPCDGERFDWVKPEYDLRNYTMSQFKSELFTANTLLMAVDGKQERTYAYTCSDFEVGKRSYVDSIRHMFVAARSEGPIPETMDLVDIHFAPSWGLVEPTGEELISYVEEALSKGTLAIFMFHNVGGGYLNVSAEAHHELLNYLKEHEDDIWTDTFINVMKYIRDNN